MSVSRRRFIVAGTLAAAAVGLADVPAALAAASRPRGLPDGIPDTVWNDPLWLLTMADWKRSVGLTFSLALAGRRVARVRLERVLNLATRQRPRPAAGQECFSLLFRGPRLKPLAQDVYAMETPSLGRFDLLIVPVLAHGKRNVYYEAVVNRVSPTP
jgi:Domain of unknown function (DUF6916)